MKNEYVKRSLMAGSVWQFGLRQPSALRRILAVRYCIQSARWLSLSKPLPIFGVLLILFAVTSSIRAQSYSVDWHKIAGGGGISTNAVYSVSGTIGQPDASGAMSGGNYSVTSGFWSLINVLQTPGAPTLYISHSGNSVTIYWQDVAGWNLAQSGNLTTPFRGWSTSSSPTLSNGTNYLTLVNPAGNLFFRLKDL